MHIARYINTYGDKVSIDSSTEYGNYANSTGNAAVVVDEENKYGSKQVTGYSDYWKVNNIYDMAGNCEELVQAASGNSYRATVGGVCNRPWALSSISVGNTADPSGSGCTSRPVLYIN